MKKNVLHALACLALLLGSALALGSCDYWGEEWFKSQGGESEAVEQRSGFVTPLIVFASGGGEAYAEGGQHPVVYNGDSIEVMDNITCKYSWWTEPANVSGITLQVSSNTTECKIKVSGTPTANFTLFVKETAAPAGTYGGTDPVSNTYKTDEQVRTQSCKHEVKSGSVNALIDD